MPVLAITSLEQLKGIISEGKAVVIDFWAEWCGPCKAISPYYEKLSNEYDGVEFCKVDIEGENLQLVAKEFDIRVIPTFKYYNGGSKVNEVTGANAEAVKALISQAALGQ